MQHGEFIIFLFILLLSRLQRTLSVSPILTQTSFSNHIMPSKKALTTESSSAVLNELKDTIRRQATEIETLKQQLKDDTTKRKTHGGAHGGGAEPSAEDLHNYLARPFYRVALKRVGWLSLFLVSLSFTALIMNGFEDVLSANLQLAYFVPLLAGHGGNTGGQSVSTVLSAISAGSIQLKDAPRVVSKEAMSGLLVGVLVGMVVSAVAHFVMGISAHVSTVVLCTLPVVSTIAATLGSSIPFICLAFKLDPSVIAAPAMTSFVDVSGLMSYFMIAHHIFGYFGVEL